MFRRAAVITTIRGRIILVTLGTCVATLVLALSALFAIEWPSFRARTARDLSVLLTVVGSNSAAALTFRDAGAAEEVLEALRARESVTSAALYDEKGELFVTYLRDPEAPGPPPCLQAPGVYLRDNHFFLCQEIQDRGERRGWAVLQADLSELAARWSAYLASAGIVFAAALLLAVALSLRLQKAISQPLLHLIHTATRVREERNYALRATKRREDELGRLVDSFNSMLEQIERQDAELRQTSDELDRRVRLRTADLHRAKQVAEDAARAKSIFLANISHELRTPMHAILSFARFGVTKGPRVTVEKVVEYFERIHQSGERLLLLLNDLLDLSKLEAGRMRFEMASTDLGTLVSLVVDEFRSLLSERGLRVEFDSPGEVHAMVDRDRILQVFRNVLANAVKFTHPGSAIEVRIQAGDQDATIEVRDHGIGIPEDEVEKIFEQFAQSRTTSSGAGGTGLGLAICREIVQAHAGRIWAENAADGGARFFIRLPLESATSGRCAA